MYVNRVNTNRYLWAATQARSLPASQRVQPIEPLQPVQSLQPVQCERSAKDLSVQASGWQNRAGAIDPHSLRTAIQKEKVISLFNRSV